MKHFLTATALSLLIGSSAVSAQESHFPDGGSWSLSATLPNGGGNLFGLWRMIGNRINVGLEVDYRNEDLEDRSSPAFIGPNTNTRDDLLVVGPSVRYYLKTEGPVAPYVRASLGIQRRDVEIEQATSGDALQHQEESSTIWRLAVGVDWFPVDGVGIGFFSGLVGVVTHTDIELGTAGTITRGQDNLSTFSSGIQLQLFF